MANVIPEGYELLVGRGRENATQALATAEERGLSPQTVLTIQEGYLIPLLTVEAQEVTLPTKTSKHEELDKFAEDFGISFESLGEKPNREAKAAHIAAVVQERTEAQDAEIAAAEAEGRTPVLLDTSKTGE